MRSPRFLSPFSSSHVIRPRVVAVEIQCVEWSGPQAGANTTMNPFPEDIFTEPDNVDPDTLANLGPLRRLAGVWESAKGVDVNPKADGPERRQYIERIEMQPIDPQANGPQLFYGLRYHVHINTPEELIAFH